MIKDTFLKVVESYEILAMKNKLQKIVVGNFPKDVDFLKKTLNKKNTLLSYALNSAMSGDPERVRIKHSVLFEMFEKSDFMDKSNHYDAVCPLFKLIRDNNLLYYPVSGDLLLSFIMDNKEKMPMEFRSELFSNIVFYNFRSSLNLSDEQISFIFKNLSEDDSNAFVFLKDLCKTMSIKSLKINTLLCPDYVFESFHKNDGVLLIDIFLNNKFFNMSNNQLFDLFKTFKEHGKILKRNDYPMKGLNLRFVGNIVSSNKSFNLNLSHEQIVEIISCTDLSSDLVEAIMENNVSQELGFSRNEIDLLFRENIIKFDDKKKESIVLRVIESNQEKNEVYLPKEMFLRFLSKVSITPTKLDALIACYKNDYLGFSLEAKELLAIIEDVMGNHNISNNAKDLYNILSMYDGFDNNVVNNTKNNLKLKI